MKATKGNKVYTITEDQQKFYTDAGYDIVKDDGEVIAYGRGKTVPYAEYVAIKKELEDLKKSQTGQKGKAPKTSAEKE